MGAAVRGDVLDIHANEGDTSPTISEIFDRYFADRENQFAERKCKHPASLRSHAKVVIELWGHWRIETFGEGSKSRVKTQVQAWREAGLKPSTCRKRISIFRAAINLAIDDEFIKRAQDPVFKLPKNGPPRERVLDEHSELPALLAAADEMDTPDHIRLLLELALRTGQRRGAILALRWEHVDFERGVINFKDTEAVEDRSKKKRGDKPMDEDLLALMVGAHKRRSDETDAVIHWRDKPVKNPYQGMVALYKRAGIVGAHTHDLRRTSATLVHNESDGNAAQAAAHIVDTEATARRHYIKENPKVHLPAMRLVSGALARARKAG